MKTTNRFAFLIIAYLISTTLFSCRGMFYNPSASYKRNIQEQPYDAIIVPGVPFEDSTWSDIMKRRVIWSVYLYKQGLVKNIIYSGSAVYSPYIEGKIMALYAEQLGVNPEHIFIEPKAEHSTENVYYGSLYAKKMGFTKVGLASDKFQSRSLAEFLPTVRRKTGVDVKSLPIQEELMSTMPHDDPAIEYELAAVSNFVSIVDRESKLKRIWGTLGQNIKYEDDRLAGQQEKKLPATY